MNIDEAGSDPVPSLISDKIWGALITSTRRALRRDSALDINSSSSAMARPAELRSNSVEISLPARRGSMKERQIRLVSARRSISSRARLCSSLSSDAPLSARYRLSGSASGSTKS